MVAFFIISGFIALNFALSTTVTLGLILTLDGHEREKRFCGRLIVYSTFYMVVAIIFAYALPLINK